MRTVVVSPITEHDRKLLVSQRTRRRPRIRHFVNSTERLDRYRKAVPVSKCELRQQPECGLPMVNMLTEYWLQRYFSGAPRRVWRQKSKQYYKRVPTGKARMDRAFEQVA